MYDVTPTKKAERRWCGGGRRSIVHCCFAFSPSSCLLARFQQSCLMQLLPSFPFLPALPTCCLNAVRVYPSVHAVSQGMWRFETLDSKSYISFGAGGRGGTNTDHTHSLAHGTPGQEGTEEAAAWGGGGKKGRAAAVTTTAAATAASATYYRRYGLKAAARVRLRRDTVALLTALSVLYDTHSSFGGRRSDAGGCWVGGRGW